MSVFFYHTSSKTDKFMCVDQNDSRFDEEVILFGHEVSDLVWNYSDRLRQQDYKRHEQICNRVSSEHKSRTAAWWEAYLTYYFDEEIEVVCIKGIAERHTGYPIYVLGYKIKEKYNND